MAPRIMEMLTGSLRSRFASRKTASMDSRQISSISIGLPYLPKTSVNTVRASFVA